MTRYLITLFLLTLVWAGSALAAEDLSELSLPALEAKAAADNVDAQYALGLRYAKGDGVEQSYAKALEWYRKAADKDHTLAMNNLGAMYELGQGVEVDHTKSIVWYRKAAEQGQKYAQNSLAIKLFKGEGTPEDRIMAYVYMRLAAEQDYPVALRNSELIYGALTDDQRAEAQLKLAEIWDHQAVLDMKKMEK